MSALIGHAGQLSRAAGAVDQPWGVYSLNKLVGVYAGASLRVRRSSDNTEQDIIFNAAGFFDQAALATFVGPNSAYVTKFYDQSGGVHDLVQSDSTKQPRIMNGGVFDGLLYFDGSNDCLVSNTPCGAVAAVTIAIRGQMRSLAGTQVFIETTADGVVNPGVLIYTDTSTGPTIYAGAYGNRVGMLYSGGFSGVHSYRIDRSQATKAAQVTLFQDGAPVTPSSVDHGAGTTDAAFTPAVWNIGARGNGASLASPLNLHTLYISESAKTDAEILANFRLVKPSRVLLVRGEGVNGAAVFKDGSSYQRTLDSVVPDVVTDDTAPKYGTTSMYFTSGRLLFPDSPDFDFGAKDFTIQTWVKFSQGSGNRLFFSGQVNSSGGDGCIAMRKGTDDKIIAQITMAGGGSVGLTSLNAVAISAWMHVALVRAGGTVTLYVNGVLAAQSSISGALANSGSKLGVGSAGEYAAGGYGSAYGDRMAGWMRDYAIDNGVALYLGDFTPPGAL